MTWRTLVRPLSLVFVAGLAALVFAFRSALADGFRAVGDARIGLLGVAFIVFLCGRGVLALASWMLAASRLARLGPRAAMTIWLRSNVGKYLPGGIWQPVSALGRMRTSGASLGKAAAVIVVDAGATIVSGLVVGILALPALWAARSNLVPWLLLAIPAAALLHPAIFRWVLRMFQRFTGRGGSVPHPSAGLVAQMMTLQAAGWLLAGVSLWMTLHALGADASLLLVVPASALSWVAGFLFVIAPAGLGVREVTLVALLGGTVSPDTALAAAIISRAMFVGMDLLGALSSLMIGGTRREAE